MVMRKLEQSDFEFDMSRIIAKITLTTSRYVNWTWWNELFIVHVGSQHGLSDTDELTVLSKG